MADQHEDLRLMLLQAARSLTPFEQGVADARAGRGWVNCRFTDQFDRQQYLRGWDSERGFSRD